MPRISINCPLELSLLSFFNYPWKEDNGAFSLVLNLIDLIIIVGGEDLDHFSRY